MTDPNRARSAEASLDCLTRQPRWRGDKTEIRDPTPLKKFIFPKTTV